MSALESDRFKRQATADAPDDELTAAQAEAAGESIEKSLCVARELLSMDIAWIAEFRDGQKIFRIVDGDAGSFGFCEGDTMPLDRSYCQRVAQGTIPNVIGDTSAEPEVRDLEVTASARIGSYIGVPIELIDGTVYGTLCVASHRPSGELAEREANFLRGVARHVASELEHLRIHAVDG
jgi:GAF domain-containing protein